MDYEQYVKRCEAVGVAPTRVARSCGVQSGTITRWKNGTCSPSYPSVLKLEGELARLQRKRENVIRAIEDGVRGLADRMNALNDEIDRLMDERAKEEFNTSFVVSKEDISAYIETFQVLGYPDDIDMKEKLVRAFLKKAVVYDDRIDIYFDCNGLPITVDLKSSTNKTSAPPTESYPNTWIITITL